MKNDAIYLESVQDRYESLLGYVRTERRNRSLHEVNEGFEYRPSITGSGAVDFE